MRIDPKTIENVSKELYIRALKILPPDVKRGFDTLAAKETSSTAQNVLGTMIKNISIAEATENLLCQDTGIPIYLDPVGLQEAEKTMTSPITLDLEGVPLKTTLAMVRVVSVPYSTTAGGMSGTKLRQQFGAVGCVYATAFRRFSSSITGVKAGSPSDDG